MSSRTEKLDRDAMLTLYAASELPPELQQRVDAMLSADETLRADLARIVDARVEVDRAMARLDQLDPMPVSAASAVRAVTRQFRQRQAEELARPMKATPGPHRRWLVMLYPAGVAAAVLAFGVYKWSGVRDFEPPAPVSEDADPRQYTRTLFPESETAELDSMELQIRALAEWSSSVQ